MIVRNHARDRLAVGWVVQRHPARADGPPVAGLACSFIVKGTFRLVADEPAEPWAEGPVALAGDTPWPGEAALGLAYPSDFVPWKPCGEWVAVGTARPPALYPLGVAGSAFVWQGTGDTSRFAIRVGVGGTAKTLEVFGPASQPSLISLPFGRRSPPAEAVPVSFALAFGGPDHPTNPIGMGAGGGDPPRLRLPDERTVSDHGGTGDRDPAGFGPVPADWPQRAATRGTYDDRWLATRWPWVPEDVDYRHFLATSPDQWIDGYFRGDESVSLVHLHPTLGGFTGLLPGIRPRLSVVRRPPAADHAVGQGFDRDRLLPAEEVPLALDTVWIDADREMLVLVWRGLAAIATPKMPDIALVTLAAERLDEPAAAIDSFLVPADIGEPPPDESKPPAVKEPPPDPAPFARAEAVVATIDEAAASVAMLSEKLDREGVFERIEAAVGSGVSPAELRARFAARAAAQGPGSDAAVQLELLDQMAAVEAAAEQVMTAVTAEQTGRARAREADQAARTIPRLPDGRVDAAEAARRGWRTLDLAGADLGGVDLSGADLAGTDLSRANLAGATLARANLAGARLVEASLARANLTAASLVAADLGKADLSGAMLEAADLSHVDFTAAIVTGTAWRGSTLTAARLAGLDLANGDFTGSTADHADFTGAKLTGATFADCRLAVARFQQAGLDGATFSRAVLQWAAFGKATAREASFTDCDLAKFRGGDAADFRGATFTRCHGAEAVFEAARLENATISRSDLTRARFAEAALAGAGFDRCDLRHAVFEDAGLTKARLTRCNLFEAVFDRADLTRASLADSNAYGCGFWESVLDGLDIAGAIVAGTSLDGEPFE